jgi:hypothetical protein
MTASPVPAQAGKSSRVDPLLNALLRHHPGVSPPGIRYIPEPPKRAIRPPAVENLQLGSPRGLAQEAVAQAEQILADVAKDHKVLVGDLIRSHKRPIFVRARFEAYWRLHEETDLSFHAIAALMRRDHKAIMYGVRKVAKTILSRLGRSA